jgi:hypothetical protein
MSLSGYGCCAFGGATNQHTLPIGLNGGRIIPEVPAPERSARAKPLAVPGYSDSLMRQIRDKTSGELQVNIYAILQAIAMRFAERRESTIDCLVDRLWTSLAGMGCLRAGRAR